MIEFLMVPGAPTPVAPFSHAAAVDGWLFVTGQMPTDPDDDSAPLPQGIEAQTRRVIENLQRVLAGVGSGLDQVVFARVYLTRFERDYAAMNTYTNHISRPPSFRLVPALGSLPLPVERSSRLICWRVSKPCETTFRLCFGWAEEGMMVWAFSPRAYPMAAGTADAARVGRVSPPSQVLGPRLRANWCASLRRALHSRTPSPFHKMTKRHQRADAVADDLGDREHRR
jgi:2-iminobutanoate/2-iminopropanoate deaminase